MTEAAGELQLERIAVGDHLLLGGDNMDLAVARLAETQFSSKGTKLDAFSFSALWQQCRAAKENSLVCERAANRTSYTLTILGRGTGLIGGTLRGKITGNEVRTLLLEGFFPIVEASAICRSVTVVRR